MSGHQGAPRPHHRPAVVSMSVFEALVGGEDPATIREAGDRCAQILVRGTEHSVDPADGQLIARLVTLVDEEGLDPLAELWSGAPALSLAGTLWRLFLLRTWVQQDPARARDEFEAGRHHTQVAEVVAGIPEPPNITEVQRLADDVLRGVRVGDYADTLFRASAFARVAAAGRVHRSTGPAQRYQTDLSASRLLAMAEQLQAAGRLELQGRLH